MDFKILLLVLCITFTSIQGAIPSCCVATAPIGPKLLARVVKYSIQHANGRCDIDALVLHIKGHGKRICVPLQQLKMLLRIKFILTGRENF